MKYKKLTLLIFLISILLIYFIKFYISFNRSKKLKNDTKNRLKESARVLNECFDLKNKNKRTKKESIELIEYCLKEYGS